MHQLSRTFTRSFVNTSKHIDKTKFDRESFEQVCKRRFLFGPSFPGYQDGTPGLLDLGPISTGLLRRITSEWRYQFVQRDGLLEVETPVLTPSPVMVSSGHVERFTDFVCHDVVTGERYRVDHLIERDLQSRNEDTKVCTWYCIYYV
jgi:glycyl-tRNA synthetase